MVSSSIMYKFVCLYLTGRREVLSVLDLSVVSSKLPLSSESMVLFQVFKETVQPETDLPGKAVMTLRWVSNNATLPTREQYAMFTLDLWKYIPASIFALAAEVEMWLDVVCRLETHVPSLVSIKAQYNARYDVYECSTMTDLSWVTAPGCSWEDSLRTPTSPTR